MFLSLTQVSDFYKNRLQMCIYARLVLCSWHCLAYLHSEVAEAHKLNVPVNVLVSPLYEVLHY